jgi:tetratricopeptide (TPR) repeat protein
MMRLIISAAALGVLAALPTLYFVIGPAPHPSTVPRGDAVSQAEVAVESWPICTSMNLGEGLGWAPLDPELAAGKQLLAAGDWQAAISVLTSAALRDDRNADIHNYLGYAHRRLRQFGPALAHYQRALALQPRHRGAHGHLGEAYLVLGKLAQAEEHLAALVRICLIPCDEYDDLKRAINEYNKIARR